MSIRFAPFHMLVRANSAVTEASAGVLHRKFVLRHLLSKSRAETQDDLLNMFFASALQHHPESKLDLLTDEQTQFGLSIDNVQLWRYPLDGTKVMQSRLAAQIAYLKALTDDATVLFMDSDMLVNGSLRELDSDDYALALTVRDDKEMPLNGGFIAVSGRRRAEAIAILEQVMESYQRDYAQQALWWGDQLALRDVVARLQNNSPRWSPGKFGPVTLLDSSVYNFSSEYGRIYSDITAPMATEKVLHFKGDRKAAMRRYWLAYQAGPGSQPAGSPTGARAAIFARATSEFVMRVLRATKRRLAGGSPKIEATQ